jgi:hypothetical protein
MKNKISVPDELITNQIHIIRNQKVMLDRDLSLLYGVEKKVLKQAVRRNSNRFPEDFMFELNDEELQNLRTQIVTSSWGGLRYAPFCFTEQGVAMLSSILKSDKAIAVNIQIIRVFTKMRNLLSDNLNLKLEVEKIKSSIVNNTKNVEVLFSYLDELIADKENTEPLPKIGYKK